MLTKEEIEINRNSFISLLDEIGFTDAEINLISFKDLILDCINHKEGLELRQSQVHGLGLYALKDFKKKDLLGLAIQDKTKYSLGRFINHSPTPNVRYAYRNGYTLAFAFTDIEEGDELFVDYRRGLDAIKDLRIS